MVVEALLDGAHRGVRRIWLVWRQGQLRISEQEQRQFATIASHHERLESWLLHVTWAKECTNYEPLISVERAVLANPPDCSRCFDRLNHNRLTSNGKHRQDRGR